LITKTI